MERQHMWSEYNELENTIGTHAAPVPAETLLTDIVKLV